MAELSAACASSTLSKLSDVLNLHTTFGHHVVLWSITARNGVRNLCRAVLLTMRQTGLRWREASFLFTSAKAAQCISLNGIGALRPLLLEASHQLGGCANNEPLANPLL
jgi:hypothetical protein